jgi:hypothetical protein
MIAKTIREKDALKMKEINPRKKKKYIDLLITNCKFNTNKFACLNLYIPLTINIKSQLRIIASKIPL